MEGPSFPSICGQCLTSSPLPISVLQVWRDLHPTHGEGLRHSLYRLSATFCCLDSKSNSPFIRNMEGLVGQMGASR